MPSSPKTRSAEETEGDGRRRVPRETDGLIMTLGALVRPAPVRCSCGLGSPALGVAAGLVLLLLFQGLAAGATSLTSLTPATYSVTHAGAPATPPVTVTGYEDEVATMALAGLPPAGTQATGVIGLEGTPTALPACPFSPCRDRYTVASPAGLTVGDYAERVAFTVAQPSAATGQSTGFLVEILVETTTGSTVGRAYLATGTTGFPGGATIDLRLYLNLATATPPTIVAVLTVVDQCSSATACP